MSPPAISHHSVSNAAAFRDMTLGPILLSAVIHVAILIDSAASQAPAPPEVERLRVDYQRPQELARINVRQIVESSGLAASRRRPGVFWTHNDSGDQARLFALDRRGKLVDECRVLDVEAEDWEDMASFEAEGRSWLLIGDVGDNGRARRQCSLLLVEEPGPGVSSVRVAGRVDFTYRDGSRDCEAVAFDPQTKQVLLVEKNGGFSCRVYSLRWPDPRSTRRAVANPIATLRLMSATALDVSPDGRRAIVGSYFGAVEYVRGVGEDWATAFSRPGRKTPAPARAQGEAICYGLDGKTLFLTSEGRFTPLWEVLPTTSGAPPNGE